MGLDANRSEGTACPACRTPATIDAVFCRRCGVRIAPVQQRLCPNSICRQPLRDGAAFCTRCGTPADLIPSAPPPQPANANCPHCGTLFKPGRLFCTACGHSVSKEDNHNGSSHE